MHLVIKRPVPSAMSCRPYMCIAKKSASHPQNCKHAASLDFESTPVSGNGLWEFHSLPSSEG